ncbi:twitch domain-containing radical SAM protein [Allomesorhizobium camelthorni]|uniref:twitch domain-containing radical SAM protein n=1 Tax=Allomesorhizobium camelthorni TaxID=475069 RepID=UPI0031B5E5EE
MQGLLSRGMGRGYLHLDESPNTDLDFSSSNGFCIRPWQQLGILPSGKARFCCLASRLIRDEAGPVSIHSHSLDDIWNGDSIKAVRRMMMAGERAPECTGCYKAEERTGHSSRLQINKDFVGGFLNPTRDAPAEFARHVTGSDGSCSALPVDLDLEMNNTCNLACRMCSPDYSSKIEADAVQSKWRPRTATALKEQATTWELLPSLASGVRYVDFGKQGTDEVGVYCSGKHWARVAFNTDRAILSLRMRGVFEESRATWKVHLKLGDRYLATSLLSNKVTRIDLPQHDITGECRIVIRAYPKPGIDQASFHTDPPTFRCHLLQVGFNEAGARTSSGALRSWAGKGAERALDLVNANPNIRRLQLMGGEPLLLNETMEILDRLIERDQAGQVVLSLVTNGTMWSSAVEERIRKFKTAIITVSMDGVEDKFEYIRHGAKWTEVAANIGRMAALPNARVGIGPTIQIYNFRQLPEMVRFAAAESLSIRSTWLTHPRYLSVEILPSSLKQAMFEELCAFKEELDASPNGGSARYQEFVRNTAMEAAAIMNGEGDKSALNEFILYTNDLDKSRGQEFKATFPELYSQLAGEGVRWHTKTRHLNSTPVALDAHSSALRDLAAKGLRWLRILLPALSRP